jgi:hypothetical protein
LVLAVPLVQAPTKLEQTEATLLSALCLLLLGAVEVEVAAVSFLLEAEVRRDFPISVRMAAIPLEAKGKLPIRREEVVMKPTSTAAAVPMEAQEPAALVAEASMVEAVAAVAEQLVVLEVCRLSLVTVEQAVPVLALVAQALSPVVAVVALRRPQVLAVLAE